MWWVPMLAWIGLTGVVPLVKTDASCEAALAYIQRDFEPEDVGVVTFATDDVAFDPYVAVTRGKWFATRDDEVVEVPPPPLELLERLQKRGERSAAGHCSAVARFLKSKRLSLGPASGNGARKGVFRRVSIAEISMDEQQAVIIDSGQGGAFLKLFERQPDGKWREVAMSGLWIA